MQLEREEVNKVPGTFGDPVRVIENLPGHGTHARRASAARCSCAAASPATASVSSTACRCPLLYHFGGLTSVINAEFLERIDFYPGGFGARYGRAMAGVVDVVSRKPECDMVRGIGEISLMLSSAYLCAPAGEWAVTAAGRRSYIDLILPLALDQIPRKEGESRITVSPVFWDYQAKARMSTGRNASTSLPSAPMTASTIFKAVQPRTAPCRPACI